MRERRQAVLDPAGGALERHGARAARSYVTNEKPIASSTTSTTAIEM
jgi:hypothetical protein